MANTKIIILLKFIYLIMNENHYCLDKSHRSKLIIIIIINVINFKSISIN